jgi:hypothetical protein
MVLQYEYCSIAAAAATAAQLTAIRNPLSRQILARPSTGELVRFNGIRSRIFTRVLQRGLAGWNSTTFN